MVRRMNKIRANSEGSMIATATLLSFPIIPPSGSDCVLFAMIDEMCLTGT